MDPLSIGTGFIIGAAFGGIAGAFLARRKGTVTGTDPAVLEERLRSRDEKIGELSASLDARSSEAGSLHAEIATLRAHEADLSARLENERKSSAEKLALFSDAQARLTDSFKALSAEALSTNNRSFLDLAKTALEKFQHDARGDLDQRKTAIETLVKPVRDSLEKVDQKIQEIEKTRAGAYEALRQQVGSLLESQGQLRDETANLVRALKAPAVRGRWGEIQLKRVVEMAGMLEHCDFDQQESAETEDGRLRPDMIVHLPGGKNIVVDAKAPLSAYLAGIESADEAKAVEFMGEHARLIRRHMKELSKKAYWDQFQPAPEFVVLFLPGEPFFSAALQQDPGLIEEGVGQRVMIATPTTLIALLRAVSYGWRQERLAENARKISELGQELYKRIADMGGHFARVGKSLGAAVDSYNRAVGSLESRVLVTARKFRELDSDHAGIDIEELAPLEQGTRAAQAQELLAAEVQPDQPPQA